MTSAVGMYGGYSYESPQVRALGNITPQSYDYRDQGKTISKLVNDVSYMAGMQRKMQQGIDAANQNVIQQIQGFISEILVVFAGGGDTGFDFGDLKYIFQGMGALFGLEPGVPLPVNLFDAAWHFFSNYLFPFSNFEEAINTMVDNFIATVLDVFGEVPILGQALQQLAAIISWIRDLLIAVHDKVEEFFDNIFGFFNFTPTPNTGGTSIGDLIAAGQSFVARLLGIEINSDTALTSANPAIAAIAGRVAVLESALGSWTDNLNRTSLGSKYDIIEGGSHFHYDGQFVWAAGLTGAIRAAALYSDEKFQTAQNYAQWTLKAPFAATGRSTFVSMSNTDMTNFVCIDVTIGILNIGSGMVIASGTSPSNITSRGTYFNHALKQGDVIGIGYDPNTMQYIAYLNNNPVDHWTDSGGIVNTSSTNRSAGFILGTNDAQGGWGVDEWAAYDWT